MKRLRDMALGSVLILSLWSCTEGRKVDIASKLDPGHMATMTTHNISTLISDSGVIQYKIVSPMWQVFDQVETPYWLFPKGLYLEKYDPYFQVIATVAADSARYYKNQRLSFIHRETATHVLEGMGFVSNDRLTDYRVIRPQGIFPVNRENISSPAPAPDSSPVAAGEASAASGSAPGAESASQAAN